jgi:aminoglycoside phosphotransferase (APT) family kinase protein
MGEQDIGDLEQVRQGIEGWLRRALPDRSGLVVADLNFPKFSGESSVTLILDAKSEARGAERFVLRMVPRSSQVFEKHDLLMQFQMMSIMQSEGLPAPPLVGYEPDATILGSDFYVMGFCEGRIPPDNPPFHAEGWVKDDLEPANRERMWRSGLETLAAIHRIDLERHDFSRLPRAEAGEPVLAQELRTFGSMFKPEMRQRVDPRILEGWTWLEGNLPEDVPPALCWGDARVGNVIFREDAPVAILDWEMANVSDPRTDLAWWIWIDRCNSEGFGLERLAGLPDPGDVYQRWSSLTGRSIEGIGWFELFAVVRYAIILELKFNAMRAAMPQVGEIPNFVVPFIPDLLDAV